MAAMGDVEGLTRRLNRVPADARLTESMEAASSRVTPLHVGCDSDWKSHGHSQQASQARSAEVLTGHDADLDAIACYRGIGDAPPLLCACWSSENLALVCWFLDHGARPGVSHLAAALGHLQRHGR